MLVNKVIRGTVEIETKQCRIIFNAKNKKEVMKHFFISQSRFRNYFTETNNKEEVELIQNNPTKIFYKLPLTILIFLKSLILRKQSDR